MFLNGSLAHNERVCNFAIGGTFAKQLQYF